ncbi:Ger(x)C family spore germination protein [Paenibacillus piri]|uniref:Ger(X)C family spore germination protein n=1 Tax=Paenibacillus piri TaxID=2547395 RepID=A0A4R5KWP3_9BACL|nr:Ger(x)C family spore germination protein [Paenibacillus piri]TDG00460.1 Ger(x)C family spore germination protein [Paenibacillus piri]
MNKRLLYAGCLTAAIVLLAGCYDRLNMEDANFPLALGMDVDNQNKFHVYMSSPEFSKNAKKKHHEIGEQALSLRQSRVQQDAHTAGVFQGRKYQVILVGKRILQQDDWFRILDVIFRDSRNTVTDRIIAFNGEVPDIIYLDRKDTPYLPIMLRDMVDTKSTRSETVKITAQELHRQIYEKGITPSISEVSLDKNKKVKLDGTALLDHRGKYAGTLNAQETVLLKILQKDTNKVVSLTLPIPGKTKTGPFDTDKVSIHAEQIKTKIKTSYVDGKFKFDIRIQMKVALLERLFPMDIRKKGGELENMIAEQTRKQMIGLIRKIQKHEIDPIGLGLYARAYEYKQYKEVSEHWGKALAEADITVFVKTAIQSMGPVK